MFNLAVLRDLVRLDPKRFGEQRIAALASEINIKYANKVIANVRGP